MIEDKELDALEQELHERKQIIEIDSVQTQFSKQMDEVKQNVLADASENDKKFVKTVVENVKDAAVKYTELEQSKADLEKQKVQYESEKLDTRQKANANAAAEDKWANRQKRREYHFNGVKPIMTFVGIDEPMNLLFLYSFAMILICPFFISKLFKGTIGVLVSILEDSSRSKTTKRLICTLIVLITLALIACLVYLLLSWRGVNILEHIKN